MAKSANINIRIDPEIKAKAEKLYSSFGITITDAINIFLHKSIMEGGLPFEMKLPHSNYDNSNVETVMGAADKTVNEPLQIRKYPSARSVFEELDREMDADGDDDLDTYDEFF